MPAEIVQALASCIRRHPHITLVPSAYSTAKSQSYTSYSLVRLQHPQTNPHRLPPSKLVLFTSDTSHLIKPTICHFELIMNAKLPLDCPSDFGRLHAKPENHFPQPASVAIATASAPSILAFQSNAEEARRLVDAPSKHRLPKASRQRPWGRQQGRRCESYDAPSKHPNESATNLGANSEVRLETDLRVAGRDEGREQAANLGADGEVRPEAKLGVGGGNAASFDAGVAANRSSTRMQRWQQTLRPTVKYVLRPS